MNNFIEWKTLNFKKTSGKEKIRCPKCDSQRSDKTDKSLLINHNDGYGKCFYCEALTFKENNQNDYSEKTYNTPPQEWLNYTKISDNVVKYIEKERRIYQSTLIDLCVTEEIYYQPKKKKEVNNIVFNYFEGEKLVNKKYRSADKCFTQTVGGKPIFYNINAVIGQDEVYIVEGEFDVLALHTFGIKNTISLPSGANDNDEFWKNSERYLKNIKKFIIAVDNDDKGNIVKEKIAQRLGRYRCEYLEFENKDANGDLIKGVLERTLKNRKKFPVSGTFKVSDIYDNIIDLYDNGLPKTIFPKKERFSGLKDVFTTMRGHLVVGTGIPSHGKSNFVDDYVLNLIDDYDFKASWFTPEHSPMELYQTNIIQKVIGRNFWKDMQGFPRITKEEINQYRDWAEERVYLTDCVNGDFPTWDWLFKTFREQMFSYGIDIFVIDAFNKVILPKGNKIDMINEVLTKLTSFAQTNNVIIFLIAHPTKMKKDEKTGLYECPTLYDVSGSADFRNQTHDGFTIYRYFENNKVGTVNESEFVNQKTKFNFQGKIGESIKLKYCDINGRYYTGNELPMESFLSSEKLRLVGSIYDIPF
jgi:twinkle protein